MGKIIFLLSFLFCISLNSQAQTTAEISQAVELFITDDVRGKDFISSDEISFSERFGINYNNSKIKFLIGYTVSDEVKKGLERGELQSIVNSEKLPDGFNKVNLSIPTINLSREFYFENTKLISPVKYFTQNWKRVSSKYFDFLISDETIFNEYCVQKLNNYIDEMAVLLNFTSQETMELSEKKILYVFCKNQDEIKNITGYASRGQFILNYDAVVTTYPGHFHEVSHFLINYKLKKLPLYTLPFIQEGFAVATGGRGGQSANVLTDIGYYLTGNNVADYKALFEIENFRNEDASISYPIAGLFSKYLLSEDVNEYINFYKKYSGEIEELNKVKFNSIDKNIFSGFEKYMSEYRTDKQIFFGNNDDAIEIKTAKSFFLTPETTLQNYTSIKFNDLFKGREYKGEKYYFAIDTNEINIYNLYSNELIASFVNSFNKTPVNYFKDGEFKFYISKNLLDEDFYKLKISH